MIFQDLPISGKAVEHALSGVQDSSVQIASFPSGGIVTADMRAGSE